MIAQKQACDVSCVQRENGIDTTNVARKIVKPDTSHVRCNAHINATAVSSPAPHMEATNILLPSSSIDELGERRCVVN